MSQPAIHTGKPNHCCGNDNPLVDWWDCRDCVRVRAEKRRAAARRASLTRIKNHPDWAKPAYANDAWQRIAHRAVADAKRQGLLPLLDGTVVCVDCGAPAQEYDHRDYSKPLDVEPVCIRCNRRRGTAIWPRCEPPVTLREAG